MIYRGTIAFDVEANSDAEAVDKIGSVRLALDGETIATEVVSVENEDWREV